MAEALATRGQARSHTHGLQPLPPFLATTLLVAGWQERDTDPTVPKLLGVILMALLELLLTKQNYVT